MSRFTLCLLATILCCYSSALFADAAPIPAQADLDKQFEKTMTNATLAGSYTAGEGKPAKDDKYTLGSVTKKEGSADVWVFSATIQFGGRNIAIPLEIPVKWAGDTAVITVDKIGIPGLGQYNARVLIYGEEYIGVWSASDGSHGGKLWGKIEHAGAPVIQPK